MSKSGLEPGPRAGIGSTENQTWIDQLNRRPAFFAALGLGVGIAAGLVPWNGLALLLGALLGRSYRSWVLLVIMFCVGWSLAPREQVTEPKKWARYFANQIDVVSIPRSTSEGYRFVGESNSLRYLVTTIERYPISLGDRLDVRGRVEELSEVSERHWHDQNVVLQIRVRSQPTIVSRGPVFWRWAVAIREYCSGALQKLLSPEDAALVDSFLLNDTVELDAETMHRLSVSGLAHLIGSVGAKIYFMAGVLFWLLSKVPLPRWTQTAIVLTGLLLYAAACGMTANGMRAFFMCAIYLVCPLFRREFDALSALSCVFVGNILVWPRVIFDVGFQLSILCILGIALFAPDVNHWLERRLERNAMPTALRHAMVVSVVCWLMSAPLIAYHQYFISLSVPIATVLAWIPFILLLSCSACCIFLSAISVGFATRVAGVTVEPLAQGLRQMNEILGSNAFFFAIPPFSAYWLVICYVLALFLWKPYYRGT